MSLPLQFQQPPLQFPALFPQQVGVYPHAVALDPRQHRNQRNFDLFVNPL